MNQFYRAMTRLEIDDSSTYAVSPCNARPKRRTKSKESQDLDRRNGWTNLLKDLDRDWMILNVNWDDQERVLERILSFH